MQRLVLLRHGESLWNKENRFTGWTDVDLTQKGYEQAKDAAKKLKEEGITFDIAYTSFLKRSIRTLWIVLDEMDLMWIPIRRSWKLNERHYGALQGLYKKEIAKEFGEEQVLIWRRSFDTPPPALKTTDPRYPKFEKKYRNLDLEDIPLTESLKDTIDRVLPYWNENIVPTIKNGLRVLVSAHGNSLRAIVKILDKIPDNEIIKLNIPIGIPLVYELKDNIEPIKSYYLAEEEALEEAIKEVEDQGKIKNNEEK
jgi:2,3-bisphosphoglycerate-dependent phosphoglycerate mutase